MPKKGHTRKPGRAVFTITAADVIETAELYGAEFRLSEGAHGTLRIAGLDRLPADVRQMILEFPSGAELSAYVRGRGVHGHDQADADEYREAA